VPAQYAHLYERFAHTDLAGTGFRTRPVPRTNCLGLDRGRFPHSPGLTDNPAKTISPLARPCTPGAEGAAIDEARSPRCAREVRSAGNAGMPTFAICLAAEVAHVHAIRTNRSRQD